MASPPKPWERPGAAGASTSTISPSAAPTATMTAPSTVATTPTSSTTPAIPPMPASIASAVNQNAAAYSRPLGAPPIGASPYGAYGSSYSSPYSSPYSRYGSYGGYGGGMSGMYGGYGGMGGMYGGGMYGGMPGMGGMPGGDPNNPESLTNRFNMSTQTTFQMLEGIVGAFGGFAQMLESTYMATHSSFFAMVAVAEQFGNLRDTLGSVLGIFTLMRWIRTLIAKVTGRPLPADATALTPAAFAHFEGRKSPLPEGGAAPKPSRKPLLFFLLAAFGIPFVMQRVIRSIAANAEEEERKRQLVAAQQQLDPSKLEFCRVLYDFSPSQQGQAVTQGVDLDVHKGDLVAVLAKTDPIGNASEWWRCRARNGQMGYLPSPYLETIQRRPQQAQISDKAANSGSTTPLESSRLNTMTGSNPATSRANSMVKEEVKVKPVMPSGKPGDVSMESFQRGGFYQ